MISKMYASRLSLTVMLLAGSKVMAHIALWDPAMFGYDPNDPNQSEPVTPLMHLPFNAWWFHGYIDKPPQADTFMTLPSGGTYHGQVACNKALTRYGAVPSQQTGIYACDGDGPSGGIGAMHTADKWDSPNPTDVKGCGIAIAYESDEHKVKPEDFAVISVNYDCPWKKDVDFQIPIDLPPCPEGGCICLWEWIHHMDAGSEQLFHLAYRCKIDGATGTTPIPRANTANKCDYPTDTSNCTVGAKQPHYWYQAEGNNNPQGEYDPPFFNNEYGFMNGAQTDLFATVGPPELGSNSTSSPSFSAKPAPSSSPHIAQVSASGTEISAALVSSRRPSSDPITNSSAVADASLHAVAAVATPASAGSTSTNVTASSRRTPTPSPSASFATCRRRKRALSQVSLPGAMAKYGMRNEKSRIDRVQSMR